MQDFPDIDALAEFAAGAGHEINNPLAIISGHAQLLLSQIQDPQQRQSLAIIAAQVRRAYEMIADIRLFARPPQPEFAPLELIGFLQKWLEQKRLELQGTPITLEFVSTEGELEIESDAVQLTVVLSALLKNAVEALAGSTTESIESSQEGRITVTVESISDDNVVLSLSDNGPGIPPEIRPLIFSPYFSGRSAGRGLGFGLSKAWRIVRQLGGTLELDATDDSGTCFTIALPVK